MGRQPSAEEIKNIQIRLESEKLPKFVSNSARDHKVWTWTKQTYSSRQFHPLWSARGRIFPGADNFVSVLENASAEGLDPDNFALPDLRAMRENARRSPDLSSQLDFDLQLTYALAQYVSQLCFGRIDPKEIDPNWQAAQRQCDVPQIVDDAIERNEFGTLADQLSPHLPEYKSLRAALAQYRETDGAAVIKINMDRLRWLADDLGQRHIRVNVPGFQLTVHDAGKVVLQMKAIVGSLENRTPIFSAEMQYLVFSPYWNIPLSIATKELLPKIKADPSYLERQQIEVIRASGRTVQTIDPEDVDWDEVSENVYQLRQRPGASNSLGLVKFIFPNPFNVYLHDTPADNLFGRLTRTLSHGCVRVEHPEELAAYVLQDQPEWDGESIKAAMHSEKEKHVPLKTRLPVHILYLTAVPGADGNVEFLEDVYGYDRLHGQLFRKR